MSSLLWILGGAALLGTCAYVGYKWWRYSKKEDNQQNDNRGPKEEQPEVPKKEVEKQSEKIKNNENIFKIEKEESIKSEPLKSQENESKKPSQIGESSFESIKEKIKNTKLAELLSDGKNFCFELKSGKILVIPKNCFKYLDMSDLVAIGKKQAIFLASYWNNETASLEEVVEEGKNGNETTYYVLNIDNPPQPICDCQLKQITIDNDHKVSLDGDPIFENEDEVDKFNRSLIEHANKHKITDLSVQQVDELVKMTTDTNYVPNKSILGDGYFEYKTKIGNVVIPNDWIRGYRLSIEQQQLYLEQKAPLYLSYIYNNQKPYLEEVTFKENGQEKKCFVLNIYNESLFGKEENMTQILRDGNYRPYLNNDNNDKIFNNDDDIHNFNCHLMKHIKTNNLGGETFEQLYNNNEQLIEDEIRKNSNNNIANIRIYRMDSNQSSISSIMN